MKQDDNYGQENMPDLSHWTSLTDFFYNFLLYSDVDGTDITPQSCLTLMNYDPLSYTNINQEALIECKLLPKGRKILSFK